MGHASWFMAAAQRTLIVEGVFPYHLQLPNGSAPSHWCSMASQSRLGQTSRLSLALQGQHGGRHVVVPKDDPLAYQWLRLQTELREHNRSLSLSLQLLDFLLTLQEILKPHLPEALISDHPWIRIWSSPEKRIPSWAHGRLSTSA